MNLEHAYRESLEELGYDLEDIYQLDDQLRGHSFNACAASSCIETVTSELIKPRALLIP